MEKEQLLREGMEVQVTEEVNLYHQSKMLPPELWLEVTDHLNLPEILALSRTCKTGHVFFGQHLIVRDALQRPGDRRALRWAIKFDSRHLFERVLEIMPGSVIMEHLLLTISHHRLDYFHTIWSLLLSRRSCVSPKNQTYPSEAMSARWLIMWYCTFFRASQILEPLLASGFFYKEDGPLHDGSCVENAAKWGNAIIMNLLIAHGAPVKGRHGESRVQPLSICAGRIEDHAGCGPWAGNYPKVTRRGRLRVAGALLRNGADVNHMAEGSTALHLAVAEKDVHMASLLLAYGAEVDARNFDGKTPLLINSQNSGSVAMAQLMLDHGADIHATDPWGRNALQIDHTSTDVILALTKLLLENGAPVAAGNTGNTVLHGSTGWLSPELVDIYLSHGVDIDIPNGRGWTPLQCLLDDDANARLIITDQLLTRTVRHLINHGARCDFVSDTGLNALEMAFELPLDVETMRLLVEKRMRPEQLKMRALPHLDLGQDQPSTHGDLLDKMRLFLEHGYVVDSAEAGGYILHEAAALGQIALLELLWEHGHAFKDSQDDQWRTPLMVAALYDKEEVVTWLVEHGADVHVVASDGMTALHYAVEAWSGGCVSRLIGYKADIESRNRRGMTPLHYGADDGADEVVQQLVGMGADVEARDHDGRTPLHHAAAYGRVDCVKVLLSGGADANSRDSYGGTPMHHTTRSVMHQTIFRNTVSALLGAGADINAVDSEGRTPLLQAASVRALKAVEDLLDNNADHSIVDRRGQTLVSVISDHATSVSPLFYNNHIRQIWQKVAEASARAQARALVSAVQVRP
jgi:ankyrin repeat protein